MNNEEIFNEHLRKKRLPSTQTDGQQIFEGYLRKKSLCQEQQSASTVDIKGEQGKYMINLENSPGLEKIYRTLDCGVKCFSIEDIVKELNRLKTARDKLEKAAITINPPYNPYLIMGVDHIEIVKMGNSPHRYPRRGINKTLNILHCHGTGVSEWKLVSCFEDISILGLVKQILEEGEQIDVLHICNPGAHPRNPEAYPFLNDILYCRSNVWGDINFFNDGRSYSSITGDWDGALMIPRRMRK